MIVGILGAYQNQCLTSNAIYAKGTQVSATFQIVWMCNNHTASSPPVQKKIKERGVTMSHATPIQGFQNY